MKITSSNFNYTFQKPSLMRQPVKDEFISFNGRSFNAQIMKIGEANIPERVLGRINEIIAVKGKYADVSIYDIHKEVYAPLLACTSLVRAKELYPEFESVKDLSQQVFKDKTVGSRIQKYEYEGLNPDDASLFFLKKVYYYASSLKSREDYLGIWKSSLVSLFNLLNIVPFKTKYANYLRCNNPQWRTQLSARAQSQWDSEEGKSKLLPHLQDPLMKQKNAATLAGLKKDPQFEKKRKAYFSTDEWRGENSLMSKERWADPFYAQNISEKIKALWTDAAYRARQVERFKKLWTSEEYRMLQMETRALSRQDPGYRERQSEISRNNWKNPEYRAKTTAGLQRRYVDNPALVEKMRQLGIKNWQNPDYVRNQQPIIKARKAAWDEMEDVKAIMKELALEFPRLGKILAKVDRGQKLTDEEEACHLLYFNMFNKLCPDFGERFSKLVRKWVAYYKAEQLYPPAATL